MTSSGCSVVSEMTLYLRATSSKAQIVASAPPSEWPVTWICQRSEVPSSSTSSTMLITRPFTLSYAVRNPL